MRAWLIALVVSSVACRAEPIEAYERDASVGDAMGDAPSMPCAWARMPLLDGSVCEGHDEDCDGVPDACDECPGFPRPPGQPLAPIGKECRPVAPFVDAYRRAYFDPFAGHISAPGTTSLGASFAIPRGGDEIVGGTALGPGSLDAPIVVFRHGVAATAIVATTQARIRRGLGQAGLLVRARGDGTRVTFLGCIVDVALLVLRAVRAPDTGCDGGPCALSNFSGDDGGTKIVTAALELPRPRSGAFGIRASVRPDDRDTGTGQFECRVFDPEQPATLHAAQGTNWAIAIDLETEWVADGDVGFLARQAEVEFRWLDVLVR